MAMSAMTEIGKSENKFYPSRVPKSTVTPMRVVHIEPEGPWRVILESALESAEPNLELIQFPDGELALPYINEQAKSTDLYIVDMRLPGKLKGVALVEAIRKSTYTGPIILVLSTLGSTDRESLISLNCDFVEKQSHIVPVVEKLFQYKRMAQQSTSVPNAVRPAPEAEAQENSHSMTLTSPPVAPNTESIDSISVVCATCERPVAAGETTCAACENTRRGEAVTRRLSQSDWELSKDRINKIIGSPFLAGSQTLVFEVEGRDLILPSHETLVVGRNGGGYTSSQLDVDLSFYDAASKGVSRRHLQITRRHDLIYVVDLGTVNGTWLNGQPLTSHNERILRDKDVLRLGKLTVSVRFL